MLVKIKQIHYHIISLMIALSLFVAGRFGFSDLLGLKRTFEFVLFFPLCLIGCIFIFSQPRKMFNPFFLLPLTYFIFQMYGKTEILELADTAAAICIVAVILTLNLKFSDLLLKRLIKISMLFAALGIVEFMILLAHPDFVSHILLFYDSYSGSSIPMLTNPLQLLGLSDGTAYHLFGMAVTRLRSFASEPSLLVGYFLVPGALGITYRGNFALYGIICIGFAICSLAGSVFAALFFSCISMVFISIYPKKLIIIFPFVVLFFFLWVLNNHYTDLILLAKALGGDVNFLDKTNSANVRFSYIRDYTPKIFASPFGLQEEIHQPLGLLVGSAARGGYAGCLLAVWILLALFSSIGFLLSTRHLKQIQRFGVYIIYGSLIAGVLYLDNCFIQVYGFTLLLLTYNRLYALRPNKPLKRPEKPFN